MATRRYGRWVIMLKQETPAYSNTSKEASGHCTIEIRNGKGRMTTFVQGLTRLQKDNVYKVCIVSAQNNNSSYSTGVTCALIPVDQKGKGEMRWEFDPDDVGGSGIVIENFNVVFVAVKSITSTSKDLITPLVGYMDERVSWKNTYKEFSKEKSSDKTTTSPEIDTSPIHETEAPIIEETEPAVENTVPPEPLNEQIEIFEEEKKYTQSENPPDEVSSLEEDSIDEDKASILQEDYSQYSQSQKLALEEETDSYSKNVPTNEAGDDKYEQTANTEPEVGYDDEKKTPATENDLYSMFEDSPSNYHKEFKEKILKYKDKMDELVNYKLISKEECMGNNISIQNMHKSNNTDLEYMFEHNPIMTPFEAQLKEYIWIRIALPDLAVLPIDVWKYGNHPFLLSGYRKYNHFILGTYFENPAPKYVLGVPGTYYPYYRLKASRLGFKQFKCCENKVPAEGDYGYWIMNISNA